MLWVLGYVLDYCICCGVLCCFGIIVLGFGRCFVFWKIVFLLGSALCIGVLRGELLGGLRNGVKV